MDIVIEARDLWRILVEYAASVGETKVFLFDVSTSSQSHPHDHTDEVYVCSRIVLLRSTYKGLYKLIISFPSHALMLQSQIDFIIEQFLVLRQL